MISMFFIGLVASILLTPGPTNTLLAASGVQMGVRNSIKLIPAEALGYIVAISVWGLVIESVSSRLPILPVVLKLFSAGFMLYLAIKLWRTAHVQVNLNIPTIHPRELFCATLLNPKALLFASAIFPAGAWESVSVYAPHMFSFVLLIVPIALFWIFIGSILTSNRISWLNQGNLQRSASVVLIGFCIPLSYSALSNF